jgi:hypothetical protein
LNRVIFESGALLLGKIVAKTVDLSGIFERYICELDGAPNFPGYSVVMIPFVDPSVGLVKVKEKED